MLQKGFIKNQTTKISKNNRLFSPVNKTTLYLGITILISALIYITVNLDKADSIVKIWLPFTMAGVILVYVSFLIKSQYKPKN